jgi:RHS repeat-associated protein
MGWRCIEERTPPVGESGDITNVQYLWGIYLDELLQMETYGESTGPESLPAGFYYPLQDLLYRTTALTDSSANIVEAYDTDAYGNTLIFSAVGSGSSWWDDDATQAAFPACPYIFTGQRFDAETGLYYYKRRYYSPVLGRFLSRDPIGYQSGSDLYEYVWDNPLTRFDPLGTNPAIVLVVPILGLTAAEAAAAAMGLTLIACLANDACIKAIMEGIEAGVQAIGATALAIARVACAAIHDAYELTESNCDGCRDDEETGATFCERFGRCVHATLNAACWTAAVTGRIDYLVAGCDFVFADGKFKGHAKQIVEKASAANRCVTGARNNC